MKYELKPFQEEALEELRDELDDSIRKYAKSHKPQIVSLTAPTGAGKTIIAAALIEKKYMGNETYVEEPDSIFLWISDSPELNEQSKLKIETKADKLKIGQCVTIDADSFDQEMLDEGHIYFLNTQKLSKTSNLTKNYDGREYTIWETLQNSIEEKADKLCVIIDEAHRGMKDTGASEATTIMQKFIKGSEVDGLSPFPVVLGMSATIKRFNDLVGTVNSTIRPVNITAEKVRKSGLLKDEIVVSYPEDETAKVDMAVLQAATDDWQRKCDHWAQFYDKQHTKQVNPIFLIQVENGSNGKISNTDLDEVIKTIENRIGTSFKDNEVVHAFGEKSTITINGLTVRHEEPSRIDENKNIKVVLFKDALSTGWDCPRAETMVSFRKAQDSTYIAQLLGRMIRTPLQQKILVDEYLNTVYLFLPYFNQDSVDKVIQELKDTEGGDLPTQIGKEQIGGFATLTANPKPIRKVKPIQKKEPTTNYPALIKQENGKQDNIQDGGNASENRNPFTNEENNDNTENKNPSVGYGVGKSDGEIKEIETTSPQVEEVDDDEVFDDGIDRIGIINYINGLGIPSYDVKKVKINDYLKSLFKLAGFLHQSGLYAKAVEDIKAEIVDMIHTHIQKLKTEGKYDTLSKKVMEFSLSSKIFDPFGETLDSEKPDEKKLSTTDVDIDRQFRMAERNLKNEGIGIKYGQKYADEKSFNAFKIDVIIFAASEECMNNLMKFAENKYHKLVNTYRPKTRKLSDSLKTKYRSIVSDGDNVSTHNLVLPVTIKPYGNDGRCYTNHLYVGGDDRNANIKLNSWEEGVLQEEEALDGFVTWLRNPDRKNWSLCIPYDKDGYKEAMYPDFIIVREDGPRHYYVDILEPHDPSREDNLGKAKGLADYAAEDFDFGRVQLIRKAKDATGKQRYKRLDMSLSEVRTRVKSASTNNELDHIFDEYGFFI